MSTSNFRSSRPLIAAFILMIQPALAQTANWRGTYRSVSAACAKSQLTIGEGWIRYMDCTNIRITTMRSDAEWLVAVVGAGKCSVANSAFSLHKESAKDFLLTAYTTSGDLQANRPSYECTFEKVANAAPPAKSAPAKKPAQRGSPVVQRRPVSTKIVKHETDSAVPHRRRRPAGAAGESAD